MKYGKNGLIFAGVVSITLNQQEIAKNVAAL